MFLLNTSPVQRSVETLLSTGLPATWLCSAIDWNGSRKMSWPKYSSLISSTQITPPMPNFMKSPFAKSVAQKPRYCEPSFGFVSLSSLKDGKTG